MTPHDDTRTEIRARFVLAALALLILLGLVACAQPHTPSPGQTYLVRVVDRATLEDAWRRENPSRADAAPGVLAFSKTGLICQIWMTPASATHAFGHEIRHCEDGHWHPER